MIGMNRHNGRRIDDEADHIRQSIGDILTTPVGSRIENRTYGSLLPDLIDHPGNPGNGLRLVAASIMAIVQWEPRVTVQAARVLLGADGRVSIELDAVRRSGPRAGSPYTLVVPLQ